GAIALADGVERNRSLLNIIVSNNKIFDEGVTAMTRALKINTRLSNLEIGMSNIGFSGVGVSGAVALAETLSNNNTLTIIKFDVLIAEENVVSLLLESWKKSLGLSTFSGVDFAQVALLGDLYE